MQYRQGDLLIVRIQRLPVEAHPIEGCVLAEGEATGHRHELSDGVVYRHPGNGQLYFCLDGQGATLVHPEHGPIQLKAGNYRVYRQREYDPDGQARQVSD